MLVKMKNEKGITLASLIIIIIVLFIIVGISMGHTKYVKQNTYSAGSRILLSEMSQVQQLVLETYTKYKQTNNSDTLVGTKITYSKASDSLKEISGDLSLREEDYDSKATVSDEEYYYMLSSDDLARMGIQKSEEAYIVNYSTGEVMNYVTKTTKNGDLLYDYAK